MKKSILTIVILLLVSISFGEEHVSSKKSQVFHRLTCRYAESLTVDNADYFASYEEADSAGFRPCKTCDPVPTPVDPEDPNDVNVIPSLQATSFFPVPNIVIQSEFCSRDMVPSEMGTRLINPVVTSTLYKDIGGDLMSCFRCGDTFGDNVKIPEEFRIPHYTTETNPADPNTTIQVFSYYSIDPNCPVFISDQRTGFHLENPCESMGSLPVQMVDIRTGVAAGSPAFWSPKKGMLEWRISPFELGDYTAVLSSDVGQTQLLAITVRAKTIPQIQEFAKYWLQTPNFNMVKFAEWSKKRSLWEKYLNRSTTMPADGPRIEWIFSDGRWVPTRSGINLISTIDLDKEIIETEEETKEITTSQMKVAAFEWRNTKIQEVTTKVTTFEGFPPYDPIPPVNYTPYKDSTRTILIDDTSEADLIEHYKELGIPMPPEEVEPPIESDKFLADVSTIRNSEALPTDFKEEVLDDMVEDYDARKAAYDAYIKAQEEWDIIRREKEDEFYDNQGPGRRDYSNMDAGMTQGSIVESIGQLYVTTESSLSEEEKELLLSLRKKLIDDTITASDITWDEIESRLADLDE